MSIPSTTRPLKGSSEWILHGLGSQVLNLQDQGSDEEKHDRIYDRYPKNSSHINLIPIKRRSEA